MSLLPSHRILLVLSTPSVAPPLLMGQEARAIFECIRLAGAAERLQITPLFAATVHDLRRALLREEFTAVHFIGHGQPGDQALLFEDGKGGVHTPSVHALAELLAGYPSIECVLLNACYTAEQAQQIAALGIPFVVAMDGPIQDNAAIEFARGFYDALAAGRTVDGAFVEGVRAVKLAGVETEALLPKLAVRPNYGYLFVMQPSNPYQYEKRLALWRPAMTIGRGACDIQIPDHYRRVSHTHAAITASGGQFYVADLKSSYGVYVDGELVGDDPQPLLHGQLITLGGDDAAKPGVCAIKVSSHQYLPT